MNVLDVLQCELNQHVCQRLRMTRDEENLFVRQRVRVIAEQFSAARDGDRFQLSLSPDGRWLAYVSDESGQPQVYVQPFPGPGTRRQVSINGGREPLWARDGRTLYYLVPNLPAVGGNMVMAVPVTSGTRFTSGKPKPLFVTRYGGTTPVRGYDIATDGRLLMPYNEPVPSGVVTHLDIIQNWSTDLIQKVPSRARR